MNARSLIRSERPTSFTPSPPRSVFNFPGMRPTEIPPYETRPWPGRVEHPSGATSVSPVSGGVARVYDSLTLSLVRIAGVRSCITNGVPRGASVRWHSSRGFWPVECQMTPHAARLIASVIVSGTGAKEIDARAAPWHCHREYNRGRLLNATGPLLPFLDAFCRRLTDNGNENGEWSVSAGIDRCYNE